MTSCYTCPKITWRNYFKSEGLAGGDFCANRLPIRITVLLSHCKDTSFWENHKIILYQENSIHTDDTSHQ